MAVLNPDHLLEQPDRLTTPPGVGAPRQADLRRAISTAYYGVFHAIAAEAPDDLVGKTQRDTPRYALVYRGIDHGRLPVICEDIVKQTPPPKYTRYLPSGGFGGDFTAVATAVGELQERRHSADYDPLFRAKTSDAVLAVDIARDALLRFRNANRVQRKTFVSLIVFTPR